MKSLVWFFCASLSLLALFEIISWIWLFSFFLSCLIYFVSLKKRKVRTKQYHHYFYSPISGRVESIEVGDDEEGTILISYGKYFKPNQLIAPTSFTVLSVKKFRSTSFFSLKALVRDRIYLNYRIIGQMNKDEQFTLELFSAFLGRDFRFNLDTGDEVASGALIAESLGRGALKLKLPNIKQIQVDSGQRVYSSSSVLLNL